MESEGFERKLTAVLSADVSGYSRLMGEDDSSTVQTLKGHRNMMASLIKKYQGRVVDSPGDNLLAEFKSVIQDVSCAVEIQREMAERNEELPDDRKMEYRIGVNLGDVIEEGFRIYGDGVNIAARLEALAEPGGICISGFVYNQVKNRLKLEYEYLGEQSVKNIKEPVPVYRVLSFPGAAAHRVIEAKKAAEKESTESSVEDKPSIAVLPFVNISSDHEQECFVDGLSEERLNSLCQITDLNVTARTSSFSFKGTNKTVHEIASVLGVENILEGSVRKAGNALRITAQLVRAKDGFHLWSKTYNRELKDIFAVQEDIAMAVADELKVTLGVGKSFKQLGGTDNEKAYELYLFAKEQYVRPGVKYTANLLDPVDEALALDPDFALAWILKASIIFALTPIMPANQIDAMNDEAINAIQKAIEIEPNLPEIYTELGSYKTRTGAWIEAELNYRKASELTSEPSVKYKALSLPHYLSVGDFTTAYKISEFYRRNDPLNSIQRAFYILMLGLLGNIDQAEEEYKQGRRMFGNDWYIGNWMIALMRTAPRDTASRDEVKKFWPINQESWDRIVSPEDAVAKLRKYYADEDNLSNYLIIFTSLCAAYFGNPEFALDVIEKLIISDYTNMDQVWYPVMKEVRQLPRFKELIREIGLVDYWNKFGWPEFCHQLDNGDLEFD